MNKLQFGFPIFFSHLKNVAQIFVFKGDILIVFSFCKDDVGLVVGGLPSVVAVGSLKRGPCRV
jgi:hypothetical protein